MYIYIFFPLKSQFLFAIIRGKKIERVIVLFMCFIPLRAYATGYS
jgi:hypothetical protein